MKRVILAAFAVLSLDINLAYAAPHEAAPALNPVHADWANG